MTGSGPETGWLSYYDGQGGERVAKRDPEEHFRFMSWRVSIDPRQVMSLSSYRLYTCTCLIAFSYINFLLNGREPFETVLNRSEQPGVRTSSLCRSGMEVVDVYTIVVREQD